MIKIENDHKSHQQGNLLEAYERKVREETNDRKLINKASFLRNCINANFMAIHISHLNEGNISVNRVILFVVIHEKQRCWWRWRSVKIVKGRMKMSREQIRHEKSSPNNNLFSSLFHLLSLSLYLSF